MAHKVRGLTAEPSRSFRRPGSDSGAGRVPSESSQQPADAPTAPKVSTARWGHRARASHARGSCECVSKCRHRSSAPLLVFLTLLNACVTGSLATYAHAQGTFSYPELSLLRRNGATDRPLLSRAKARIHAHMRSSMVEQRALEKAQMAVKHACPG
eukprot:scaffold286584_cov18-Tisochrysis_lutea.AAC.4